MGQPGCIQLRLPERPMGSVPGRRIASMSKSSRIESKDMTVRRTLGIYAASLLATFAAIIVRALLDPYLGERLPLVTLFGAVALAVYLGGYRPAILVTALGYIACDYQFIAPRGSIGSSSPPNVHELIAFVATCAVIVGLGEGMRAARSRARRGQELLRTTLASIGDAIITTDRDGRVNYMNAVAESITGWTQPEAFGRPLEAVFRVMNEQTGEAVGSGFQGLREGRSVGPNHHAVLLTKTGAQVPIDDRAAPIKDQHGQELGCVLIFRDVAARRESERALTESEARFRTMADALKEADRQKDAFLATLAHELRNPLAPIRNSIQLLRMKGASDAESEWGREVIDRQVNQMVRLLDDLLDVSRISYNKLQLRKERVDLRSVIQSAIETSRPLIDAAGHELAVVLPTAPIPLFADPVRLAQIFSNLLNNAAKYTRPGGHIRLAAERRDGDLLVSVKDDGIGITPEMLPQIFCLFSQGSAPVLERSQAGLGIGLALVRGLVELHGGGIEARSAGPERGSEFLVCLPTAVDEPVAAEHGSEAGHGLAPFLKHRVLIADDLKDSADSLAILLSLSGHEAQTAYDGEEAIRKAVRLKPDVALLDIGMPKLNGYDLCKRIRAEEWGQHAFLVAVTGWGQEGDRRRAKEAGFDCHLVKPVDPVALMRLMANLPVEA